MLKRMMTVAAGALIAAGLAVPADADVIDTVKKRGKLIVGVKADYKPYGYLDPSGKIIGIEPDLAQDVAKKLGVGLELIPVVAANRMQFLQQGKIDLMIATTTDTPERRKVVQFVDPNYYSSGTNILAPKKLAFKTWQDLRGKPICGIQGAFYNKKTQQEFGAEIIAFKGTAEVYTALKQGRCLAFVYDDSSILGTLQDVKEWGDYEMPLETIDDQPWGLAVAQGENKFAEFISAMIKDWHKSGRILQLEAKYGVKNTPFARTMHDRFKGS